MGKSKNSTDGSNNVGQTAAWLLAVAVAGTAYALIVRPRHLRWGATERECAEVLPGDEFTEACTDSATHAITIEGAPTEVWPWLVQIGQDKGGFYSYAWLENLMGCHMRNADHILAEYQSISVGDTVLLHPKAPPLPVVLVEHERALVLGSNTDEPGTWGFHLKEVRPGVTRLVVRCRTHRKTGALRWGIHYIIFEPAHFVMERKMLLTLKHLVESSAAPCRDRQTKRARIERFHDTT